MVYSKNRTTTKNSLLMLNVSSQDLEMFPIYLLILVVNPIMHEADHIYIVRLPGLGLSCKSPSPPLVLVVDKIFYCKPN